MQYKLLKTTLNQYMLKQFDDEGNVIVQAIPMHESNSDYQEYLKWVAEGNEPLPADE
jgi:hypothetical protein